MKLDSYLILYTKFKLQRIKDLNVSFLSEEIMWVNPKDLSLDKKKNKNMNNKRKYR